MDVTTTIRALSDSTRRTVLELLRDGDRSANDLAQHFSMSRPAVSKHLAILREAGLVSSKRDGRQQIYALDASSLESVRQWLRGFEGDQGDPEPEPAGATKRTSRPRTRQQAGWRSW